MILFSAFMTWWPKQREYAFPLIIHSSISSERPVCPYGSFCFPSVTLKGPMPGNGKTSFYRFMRIIKVNQKRLAVARFNKAVCMAVEFFL